MVDWEKSQERFRAFWERQLVDRPVVQVYAHKRPGLPKGWWRILNEPVWAEPERTVEEMLTFFDGIHFAGDAYPMWYPNLGPGVLTAFLGNRIHFDLEHDTSWQDHTVSDLSSWRPQFDHQNAYWQATLHLTERIAAAAPGRFIAGITDLGMGADLLAAVRGADGLCMDMMDCPDVVQARLSELRQLWQQCYQTLYDRLPAGNGSNCWLAAWAPGRTYPLQNDFSCMISPEMYREFFLEDLVAHCDWLDYAVYHLDGPGAVPHLDMLLEIPSLRAIQWTPGAGQPPMPYWLPMLRRIQAAGKGLFLYTAPQELDALMDGLRPEGVILNLWAGSPAEADALVDKVAAWGVKSC
jgi:hypothetical protein